MTKFEDKMRIGIVGAGAVTKDLHIPVLVNMPTVQLKWICDKNEERARRLAKLFKIPAVFTDVEEAQEHFGERESTTPICKHLCSGYGIYPDGRKCNGCLDCE